MAGWNRPSGPQKPAPKKPSAMRGIVAGLAAVAIAGVCVYAFMGKSEKPVEKVEKKPGRIKEIESIVVPTNAAQATVVATNAVEKVKRKPTPEEQKRLRPGDEGFDPAAHPFVLVPKKKKKREPLPFRNSTEQQLAWIANCEPGDDPLPLLPIPAGELEHFAEILLDKNVEQEGDMEWTKEQRKVIEFAKSEMRQYIKNGGTPEAFMSYYHKQLEQMHVERREAQTSVMEMLRNSDNDDIANEYVKKVNERLAAKGIKPIALSKKKMAQHGIVAEEVGIPVKKSTGEDSK